MKPRTVYTVLDEAARKFGEKPALRQPGAGAYRTWTWRQYRDTVREMATGLRELGLKKGDVVALQSETRAEFYLADIAVMAAGGISAALYTSLPFADQAATLRAADARMAIVEHAKAMRGLISASADPPPDVPWIVLTGDAEGARTLEDIRRIGQQKLAADPNFFDTFLDELSDDDPAILYMTSGATGAPKMGIVTHRAVVSNVMMGPAVLPLTPDDATIAFLPSAHIAQRVVVELLPMVQGAQVWFSESLARMPNEIRHIRPTFFLAPPRVWERMYASIQTEIRKKPPAVRRMFYAGVGLGSEAARRRQQGKSVPLWMKSSLAVFDRAIFQKVRDRLGGRLRVPASGAAPLGKELAEFYAAIGMPLIEGYGLTEGGVVSLNPLDRPKSGSIGKMLPGVEARLSDDGELLIRSPCLFSGYYKDPEATAAILRDGWLATGDIAENDADGYWYITGRKKELIVSSNGKKIYPARIEALFKKEILVNQVLLIGDKMPYVTALVTINTAAAESLKGMEELRGAGMEGLVTAAPLKAEVDRAVKDVNKHLAPFEQIRKYKILDREFSIDRGEVTPTMKLRRGKVLENYRALISEMYQGKDLP